MPPCAFFRRENCLKLSFVIHRAVNASIFFFDHVNLTSQVYTLSKVNMADSTSRESSSISGSDYSDFEASMEGEHSERVYESVGEIRLWQLEPPGQT